MTTTMTHPIFDAIRRRSAHDVLNHIKNCSNSSDSSSCSPHVFGVDPMGRSPLFRAVESGYLDLVEPLLNFYSQFATPIPPPLVPPKVRPQTTRKLSPAVIAADAAEQQAYADECARRAEVEKQRKELGAVCQIDAALVSAATYAHADLIEMLLLRCQLIGGDVNACDSAGNSVLHGCCARGHVKAVSLLIRKLGKLSEPDRSGLRPLHLAAAGGHEKIAYLLIVNRAPVNVLDNAGLSPLHTAVLNGKREMVAMLLDNGADCNTQDYNLGMTPLMDAIRLNHVSIWRMLLPIPEESYLMAVVNNNNNNNNTNDSSNDASQRDNADTTRQRIPDGDPTLVRPYHEVLHESEKVEASASATTSTATPTAAVTHHHRSRADVHARNKKNITALEFAVLSGNARAVRRLLHCGADPGEPCTDPTTGDTLLHVAVRLGYKSIVRRLCQPKPVYRPRNTRTKNNKQEEVEQVEQQPTNRPATHDDKKEQNHDQQLQAEPFPLPDTKPEQVELPQQHQLQQQNDAATARAGVEEDHVVDQDDDDDEEPVRRPLATVGSLKFDYVPPPPPTPPPPHFEPAPDGFNNVFDFPWIKCCNVLAKNKIAEQTALDLAMEQTGEAQAQLLVQHQQKRQQHQQQQSGGATSDNAAQQVNSTKSKKKSNESKVVAMAINQSGQQPQQQQGHLDDEKPASPLSEMEQIVLYLKKLVPRVKKQQQSKKNKRREYRNEFERQIMEAARREKRRMQIEQGLSSEGDDEEEEEEEQKEPAIVFSSDDEEEEYLDPNSSGSDAG